MASISREIRDFLDFLWPFLSAKLASRNYRFGLLVLVTAVFLYFTIRLYWADKSWLGVIKSRQFLVSFGVLLLLWGIVWAVLFRPSYPLGDGRIHITVGDFGRSQDAEILRQYVNQEIRKHLRLFNNVVFHENAVRDPIRNSARAEALARARGFHMIVYGSLDSLNGTRRGRANLIQTYAYEKISLGPFTWEKASNLPAHDAIKAIARDVALKILRACDQHEILKAEARHKRASFNMVLTGERRATFNLGSNITQRFLLGENREGRAFLEGFVSDNGTALLNGRVFDSDGQHFATINENHFEFSDPSAFSRVDRGESFILYDRYERMLLEYRVEMPRRDFINRYSQAQREQAQKSLRELEARFGVRLPFAGDGGNQTTGDLESFARIVTINGEIYREDGILGVILRNEELYHYALRELWF